MIVNTTQDQDAQLAQRSFHVITQVLLSLPHGRRRELGNLKEMEFFTLSILKQNEPMIVGDIQRILGILPAQMSRIIRSLEGREEPLINCEINPNDKRKINVRLTTAGLNSLNEYLEPRVSVITSLLEKLNEDEREDLSNLLERVEDIMETDLEE